MDWPDLIQWPAMIVTVVAAWMTGSHGRWKRSWGFWLFITSNALWAAWGWHAGAYALITLQIALALINIRGARNNSPVEAPTQR